MARFDLIMVRESTAAKMLELSVSEFRNLIALGSLPQGRVIGPRVTRWDVEALRSVARGDVLGWREERLLVAEV
jgi:predicted DNA-binding transcriptional regulator AlpA